MATAPAEKLLIGRRPVRNWTQLHFFLFVSLAINDTYGNDVSSLFLCVKSHLFLGKSTKTAATRASLFDSMQYAPKTVVGWGFAPDPTGGAYSAPRPFSCIQETYF